MESAICKLYCHSEETMFHGGMRACQKNLGIGAGTERGLKLPRLHPVTRASDFTMDDAVSKDDKAYMITLLWRIC